MANQAHHARRIPYLFMRGGTSKGGYFLKQHLPTCPKVLSKLLLTVYGTVQPVDPENVLLKQARSTKELLHGLRRGSSTTDKDLQEGAPIDQNQVSGIGGATGITSKAAILSKSTEKGIDVEYTFAQVCFDKSYVDFQPSCGNILSGVGPAAIEMGLIDKDKIGEKETTVTIKAMNNNSVVTAIIQTPGGEVSYEGTTAIDGVGGRAAPVILTFTKVVGSKSGGKLLPTGNLRDTFNGIEVTCIDVAMPMVIAKASSFGKNGLETPAELDADVEFFKKLEAVRRLAGKAMGYGDVSDSVIPKFAIVAEKANDEMKGGDKKNPNITARYFVPNKTHKAMAVTGAICLSCCSILKGSVAHDVYMDEEEKQVVTEDVSSETEDKVVTAEVPSDDVSREANEGEKNKNMKTVVLGHPSGSIQIVLETEQKEGETGMTVASAGVVRTARLIGTGFLRVPSYWWDFDYEEKDSSHKILSKKLQDRIDEYHRDFVKLFKPEELFPEVAESRTTTEDAVPVPQ